MPPRSIDKDQRRKQVALAALDLFAEKGLESTSITEIAERAGIGKGTVYEYFASKEELIFNAFTVWLENMMGPELEELLLSIKDPAERFRKCVQVIMEAFITDERTVRILLMMFQMMLKDEQVFLQNATFQKLFQTTRKLFIDTLLEGVSQGSFKPEIARDAEKIAINLLAYLDGIAVHYLLNKDKINLMGQVNFYLDRLIRDIVKGG